MYYRLIIFLLLNFAALGIGGLFTGEGVPSQWYQALNKAPWTPPGWVFGAAWTTIMVCFALYMMRAWEVTDNHKLLIGLFAIQWILNVLWNPMFFKYHEVMWALLIIVSLTILVGYFLLGKPFSVGLWSLWVLPYFVWLLIASSLNAYILLKN